MGEDAQKEIYRLLAMKAKCYLPPEPQANSDFIRDIMVGKRRFEPTIDSEFRFSNS